MRHLGDITKIDGAKIAPVDIVTFGAPCQDLSQAGARRGMKHEAHGDEETTRSGLFFEAMRIIKEGREHELVGTGADDAIRSGRKHYRYAIYENVPGALSSNGGHDWQAVLTEFVRVVVPSAPAVPMPQSGRWSYCGSIYGVGMDGQPFTVAWRLHDSQWFGLAQRRKRLCVLADYAGVTAPWILFDAKYERTSEDGTPYSVIGDVGGQRGREVSPVAESVCGDTAQSGETRQGTAESVEGCSDGTGGESLDGSISFQERAGCAGGGKGILIQHEHVGALSTLHNQSVFPIEGNGARESHKGRGYGEQDDAMFTLNATEYHAVCESNAGGAQACDVYNQSVNGQTAPALTAEVGVPNHSGCKVLQTSAFFARNSANARSIGLVEEQSPTLTSGQIADVFVT